MAKTTCKTPFWQQLKTRLNNLEKDDFLKKFHQTDNALLIDVRSVKEFEVDHWEDAVNYSYHLPDLWDRLEIIDKERTIFVCCRSGRRSIRVCTLLRNGGFDPKKIFNLDGGIGEM